jgi:pyruvate dehydrogenase E2 component (dihydrolipoamide acetyltransferase)
MLAWMIRQTSTKGKDRPFMATPFNLPDLGENIASGDVVSVFVSPGDVLAPGQSLLEVETDKAVIEVPCTPGGRVAEVLVKKGDTVQVGQPLVMLEPADASAVASAPPPPPSTVAAAAEPPAAATAPVAVQPAPPPAVPAPPKAEAVAAPAARRPAAVAESPPVSAAGLEPAGPAVRRLARELGVELSRVTGSGPGGRILREDVVAAVREAGKNAGSRNAAAGSGERDDWGPIRREAMSRMRRTIATNMVRSVTEIPHLTNFDDADVTELEGLRKASSKEYAASGVKLTALAFVIKAVSLSLRQHPGINASVDMESGQLIYKEYVNIGLAVDTPRGLVVPVLRDVDEMSIPQVAKAIVNTAEKAKEASYSVEDLRGGTFTISNLGAVGGSYSTPIINYPEVAILLVGRSRKLPMVRENVIEPRMMMPLSLSYDHRVIDGAMAARFLNEIIGYLESPGRLLLAM